MKYTKFFNNHQDLSNFDIEILSIIFDSPLPYLDILCKQLSAATITADNCITNYFLDIKINALVEAIPMSTNVPVTIDICPDIVLPLSDTAMSNYFESTGTAHLLETSNVLFFPQNDNHYIGILLHFSKGIIQSIEVVNWAGSPINRCIECVGIEKWKKIFRYNDRNWYDIVINQEYLKAE